MIDANSIVLLNSSDCRKKWSFTWWFSWRLQFSGHCRQRRCTGIVWLLDLWDPRRCCCTSKIFFLFSGTFRSINLSIDYPNRRVHNRTGVAGQIVSENIVFVGPFYRNISRIRAFDLNSNFTGGFATIVNGGVNQRNVTLRLQASAIGRGYWFDVDIYGH